MFSPIIYASTPRKNDFKKVFTNKLCLLAEAEYNARAYKVENVTMAPKRKQLAPFVPIDRLSFFGKIKNKSKAHRCHR